MDDEQRIELDDIPAYIESLLAEIGQLQAERDALKADAERYRWLRDTQSDFYGDEYGFTFVYECAFDDFKQPARGLDAAIDAERGE